MKKLLPPLAVLAVIFLFAAVNSNSIARSTERWQSQLLQAEDLAAREQWEEAAAVLEESYRDWEKAQTSTSSSPTTRWTARRPCTTGPGPLS